MDTKLFHLAQKVGHLFLTHKLRITTAESCTGGGLSYWLTSVPGSSAWFDRGFVTYSNTAKMAMLSVSAETLDHYGAVSEETAVAMAQGALNASNADVSVAITGIAGPDGGSAQKPLGLVWFAIASQGLPCLSFQYIFAGNRDEIRTQSIVTALEKLSLLSF